MRKLNFDAMEGVVSEYVRENPEKTLKAMKELQIVVYTMLGGSMLGSFAARQPADFYIDGRVSKLPFGKREIMQAVKVLEIYATALGLNAHNLEFNTDFHNCGIF